MALHDLGFGTYVGLEEEAVSTKYFQSSVIPGLLQTADYARAVHEAVIPLIKGISEGTLARCASFRPTVPLAA